MSRISRSSPRPSRLGAWPGIVVYENVWAVPLIAAIDRNGARIIGDGRVDVDDVLTAIDRTEPV